MRFMVKLKAEASKSICYYSENTRLKGILGPIEQLCDFFKNVCYHFNYFLSF